MCVSLHQFLIVKQKGFNMNRLFTFIATALIFCAGNQIKVKAEIMDKETKSVQEWDKTFPKSEKVNHEKVTFKTQYGLTLAADLYIPKNAEGKLPAIAVSGPFGAVKEQCSGLYAQTMAERGFITIAFDPSFTGESSGEPRRTASPDINTEDFLAAVDYLSMRDDVDAGRIAIIGICGWGGIALNAAAQDPRIKATAAITMYDMSRVSGNGYFDADDSEEKRYSARKAWAEARTADLKNRTFTMAGGVVDPLPENAPQFVKSCLLQNASWLPQAFGQLERRLARHRLPGLRQHPFSLLHQRNPFGCPHCAWRESTFPLLRKECLQIYDGWKSGRLRLRQKAQPGSSQQTTAHYPRSLSLRPIRWWWERNDSLGQDRRVP